jgi:hypothetical protein
MDDVSDYLMALFKHHVEIPFIKVQPRSENLLPPPAEIACPAAISEDLAAECNQIAFMLGQAVRRHSTSCLIHSISILIYEVRVEWDASEYAAHLPGGTSISERQEQELAEEFPPLKDTVHILQVPAVVVDASGAIITWYLPKVLSAARQVSSLSNPWNFCYSFAPVCYYLEPPAYRSGLEEKSLVC